MARTDIRSTAIIIKNGKVLLIHRIKEGKEFWVFPGGRIEEGETAEEAVAREVKEETGLTCTSVKLAFMGQKFESENIHPFYFCNTEDGEVVLGGPEAKRQSEENWYRLEWTRIEDVSGINLVPESAKAKFLELKISAL